MMLRDFSQRKNACTLHFFSCCEIKAYLKTTHNGTKLCCTLEGKTFFSWLLCALLLTLQLVLYGVVSLSLWVFPGFKSLFPTHKKPNRLHSRITSFCAFPPWNYVHSSGIKQWWWNQLWMTPTISESKDKRRKKEEEEGKEENTLEFSQEFPCPLYLMYYVSLSTIRWEMKRVASFLISFSMGVVQDGLAKIYSFNVLYRACQTNDNTNN